MSKFAAIVVAAGDSVRMKKTGVLISKPLISLEGVPMIVHTLRGLSAVEDISQIVLVIRPEDAGEISHWIAAENFSRPISIVYGGSSRQQSVRNGVEAVTDAIDYLMIHDGARPLVTREELSAVMAAAMEKGAATLAVRVKDTIKMVDAGGKITMTPDRSTLWAVHTPQVFEKEAYRSAMRKAEEEGQDFTDDCQLIEYVGRSVWVVEGKYTNLKITTAEDITLAETILRQRAEFAKEETI